MNILFAHDEKLQKINGKYYTTGSLGNSIENKYLKYFDRITLLLRCEELDCKSDNVPNLKEIKNVDIVEVKNWNLLKLNFIKKVVSESVKKSDKIIARLPSIIGSLAVKYAKKYNKPYIIELVGCPWDSLINHGSIKAKMLAPFIMLKTRYQIYNANNVLYVTNKFLQNRYPNKKKNIACSDVEIIDIGKKKLNEKIGKFNKDNIKLGIIGSLTTKYKGHEEIFRALAILKDEYNIKLHLVGYGDLDNWKKLIKELDITQNIIFEGTKESGRNIWEWLDNIDIYLQPSLTEGMPRSTIEAMSRGCPVISTNVGGFPEIIEKDFMINKRDWLSLYEKIKILIENNEIYRQQSLRNYIMAQNFLPFNLEIIREEFYKNFN